MTDEVCLRVIHISLKIACFELCHFRNSNSCSYQTHFFTFPKYFKIYFRITGCSELYVKNMKASRGDLNKNFLEECGAKIHSCGSRGRF